MNVRRNNSYGLRPQYYSASASLRPIVWITVLISISLVVSAYVFRTPLRDLLFEVRKSPLPEARVSSDFAAPIKNEPEIVKIEPSPTLLPAAAPAPPELNLAVKFASQAPHQNWALPYQEACEEASMIMVAFFDRGEELSRNVADQEIKKLVEWQTNRFGDYKDTDAQQNKIILTEYFGYKSVDIIENFDVPDIQAALAAGRPVIIPAAGRKLKNPFYKQPGPLYHMLVIKGYTKDGMFITNDPGTRRGRDYLYSPEILLNAAHDWNNGDVENGARIMIVPSP